MKVAALDISQTGVDRLTLLEQDPPCRPGHPLDRRDQPPREEPQAPQACSAPDREPPFAVLTIPTSVEQAGGVVGAVGQCAVPLGSRERPTGHGARAAFP
jgi:hypothetical protein